ncbi:MAG: hypothetical protein JXL84_24870 [Deltaproteobacteria bacterium]|nr:hypothetical protein [Deltaproteobacteria bacterium]
MEPFPKKCVLNPSVLCRHSSRYMAPASRLDRFRKGDFCLVALLALGAGVAWVLTKGRFLSGDEAVLGLMALKISQGMDFPIFFWKAHYSGPLAGYLAAPLYFFLKPSVFALWVPAVVLHLLFASGVFLLVRRMWNDQAALAAGLCVALPFDLFPYAALCGYTESLSFAPWILLLICRPQGLADKILSRGHAALAGLLSGFVLWVSPVSIPLVFTSLVYVGRRYGSEALRIMFSCTLVGLVPFFIYNIIHPGASVLRLLARPASLDKAAFLKITTEQGLSFLTLHVLQNWGSACLASLRNLPEFTLQLFGITPEANGWSLAAGIAALIGFLTGCLPRLAAKDVPRILDGILPTLALCTYAFTILFGLDRYRYLIPALFLVPFGVSLGLDRLRFFLSRSVCSALLGILLLINAFSNFSSCETPRPSWPEIVRFLDARGFNHGYAEYDIAYPLVYLSNERLIYTPFFHTPQYDRYAPYTQTVNRSAQPAFLFSSKESALDFRRYLEQRHSSHKEEEWGGFTIFHDIHQRPEMSNTKWNAGG